MRVRRVPSVTVAHLVCVIVAAAVLLAEFRSKRPSPPLPTILVSSWPAV